MAAPKGECKKEKLLFGKYRLLEQAGSGRTGTVWKAFHVGLEEYRAVKCVPKSAVDYQAFRREALILKGLRHPGIPLVYDLEEDETCFYLIEEYLHGCSLYALVRQKGVLAEAEAVRYGIQICSLMEYLHSECEPPILHLDLQPNNLIVNGGTIRLIDFGHAADAARAGGLPRYGTVGCAAPEQYTSDRFLDQRTDVYAIGAVLQFMVHGTCCETGPDGAAVPPRLKKTIAVCMEQESERRFASAAELSQALAALLPGGVSTAAQEQAAPSLTIVLAAGRPGAGATHLALALCRLLADRGCRALYEERGHSQAIRALAAHRGARPDADGIYHIAGCRLRPWYGPAARLPIPASYEIRLKDFGCEWEEAAGALREDGAFLICAATAGLWEKGQTARMLERFSGMPQSRPVLVFRHLERAGFYRTGLARMRGQPRPAVFLSPEYANPFYPGAAARRFLEALLRFVLQQADNTETRRRAESERRG